MHGTRTHTIARPRISSDGDDDDGAVRCGACRFVNVSPLGRHHSESISSLRFAAKAGGVEVGPAEKKVRKD